MLGLILLSIFVCLVLLIIVLEIRNERKYQAERKRKNHSPQTKTRKTSTKKSLKKEKSQPKEEVHKLVKDSSSSKKSKKLPQANYPAFTHVRLLEMGLSDDEAKEFVQELIPQLEEQIPLIYEALKIPDFHQMERLTHSIKGSTTNLGTGGISDLLIEYNTYLKTGTDLEIATTYFEHLKTYTQAIKNQYS